MLQYASDIPSAQQRFPGIRPPAARTKSGRPAAPKLAGRNVPVNVPVRSSKLSEKLVLLPETDQQLDIQEKHDFDQDNELAPERDDEETLRKSGVLKGKSYAERLPKSRRADKLPRVTAYCTAQSYRLKVTAEFLRDQHGARTKLYDDCLYAVFQLPLLPGTDGFRVRSSPVKKNPGGKNVLDEAIEQNEQRHYAEGYFEGSERFSVDNDHQRSNGNGNSHLDRPQRRPSNHSDGSHSPTTIQQLSSTALSFAELYIFSYGIAVFWNFTLGQEKDILADMTFYSSSVPPLQALVMNPQNPADFETEDFHFQYDPLIPRPRVFNDMITLRSGDHMLKLTISHAIAQSVKLSTFEQQMTDQMGEAQHIPRRLALTGKLGLTRKQVVRILGAMYRSRVEVNLSSNVLDTPSFFWESEPTLHPLYAAVREYLEIGPRVKVLNERCRVFLDLAEILSDAIADSKMSKLTWIIIWLIAVSIAVTITEVVLRFGLLHAKGGRVIANPGIEMVGNKIDSSICVCPSLVELQALSSAGAGIEYEKNKSKIDQVWEEVSSGTEL